jgi:hypothetical protein
MASLLVLTSNNPANPQTIDLTNYVVVDPGQGLDPADPAFTQRVWSRSLLKEGATLALEQLVEREMMFPLKLGPIGGFGSSPQNLSATLGLIQQINQIIETPGATMTWQPPGASQPTTFDILSGLVESAYNYRAEGQGWEFANLRVFTQPLGRTGSIRTYALAQGLGPITYVAPSSYLQTTPSPGVITYYGNPSLAGDGPAKLVITTMGASNVNYQGFVSLFPDSTYPPMSASQITNSNGGFIYTPSAPAGVICPLHGFADQIDWTPIAQGGFQSNNFTPPIGWEGLHRLFVFARASANPASPDNILYINGTQGNLTAVSAGVNSAASIQPGSSWGLYDLGTVSVRASESFNGAFVSVFKSNPSSFVDIGGMFMLPDNSTWFLQTGVNPVTAQSADFGSLILDDIVAEQFSGGALSSVSPSAPYANQFGGVSKRTSLSRGLVPQPDPKNGLPIIAVCTMPNGSPPATPRVPGLYPPFKSIQVGVWALERTRYVLP